jgi:hypothetical protein
MPIRDILVTVPILGAVLFILIHPYIGALLWVIVGVMNPHRLTWGFAYEFPFAAVVAGATFIGLFVSKDPKRYPVNAVTMTLGLALCFTCRVAVPRNRGSRVSSGMGLERKRAVRVAPASAVHYERRRQFYNHCRPHSSLGNRLPVQVRQEALRMEARLTA